MPLHQLTNPSEYPTCPRLISDHHKPSSAQHSASFWRDTNKNSFFFQENIYFFFLFLGFDDTYGVITLQTWARHLKWLRHPMAQAAPESKSRKQKRRWKLRIVILFKSSLATCELWSMHWSSCRQMNLEGFAFHFQIFQLSLTFLYILAQADKQFCVSAFDIILVLT